MMDLSQLISGRGVSDYQDIVHLLAQKYPSPAKPYTALKALGDHPHSEYLIRALTLHAIGQALPSTDRLHAHVQASRDSLVRSAFMANRLSCPEFRDVIALSRKLIAQ